MTEMAFKGVHNDTGRYEIKVNGSSRTIWLTTFTRVKYPTINYFDLNG